MRIARYKLSLRTKIVATIIGVTLLVVVGGAWKAAQQVHAAETSNANLDKSLRRYVDILTQLGNGEYAVTRMIANDPAISSALATADSNALAQAAKRIGDVMEGSLVPDLFVISDLEGRITPLPAVKAPADSEWKRSRLLQDLRE